MKVILPKKTKLHINGEYVNCTSGKEFPIINPTNEEEICKVQEANEYDVNLAYEAAENAFESWSKLNLEQRQKLLLKIAGIFYFYSRLF